MLQKDLNAAIKRVEKDNAILISECELSITNKNILNPTYFYCASTTLPFCCGVIELGEFYTYYNPKQCSKDDYLILVAETLLQKIKENTGLNKHKKLIMFNLVNNRPCKLFEEAITKYLPGRFKCVTEFNNMNSGNKIKTFIQIK